jgi:carboxyl-terminal processing protease
MRISRFRDNTGDQVLSALESLNQFQMLALILDLRTNPGGSAEAAGEVAGQFLPTGTLFRSVEGRDGIRTEELIVEDVNRLDLDNLLMAVLVNDQTIGEAEAVAGALQDAGRAFVVGIETFGEGSNYSFVELSNNSAMYLPTSRWFTPSGLWLGGKGITPDLVVDSEPEDQGFGGESQFNRAYEHLGAQLPPFR